MYDRATIVDRAKAYVGHREVAPNSSPMIDVWPRRCGVRPGLPWCAAFASWCVYERDADVGAATVVSCAGAIKLGRMFPATRNPQPGDLMWFATDGKGSGHVGIVIAGCGLDEVLCIEGNSADGVRYVRRLRSEVRFSATRSEVRLLPNGDGVQAPLAHVSKAGTL